MVTVSVPPRPVWVVRAEPVLLGGAAPVVVGCVDDGDGLDEVVVDWSEPTRVVDGVDSGGVVVVEMDPTGGGVEEAVLTVLTVLGGATTSTTLVSLIPFTAKTAAPATTNDAATKDPTAARLRDRARTIRVRVAANVGPASLRAG